MGDGMSCRFMFIVIMNLKNKVKEWDKNVE